MRAQCRVYQNMPSFATMLTTAADSASQPGAVACSYAPVAIDSDRGEPDAGARRRQYKAKRHGRQALEALVAVRVALVRIALRDSHAQERNGGGEHIGQRVHGVRNHGSRVAEYACEQFERRQRYVAAYSHNGKFVRDALLIELRTGGFARRRAIRRAFLYPLCRSSCIACRTVFQPAERQGAFEINPY